MNFPSTHVCLIYDTVTSNLTPVLDPQFGVKRVILLHDAEHAEACEYLTAVLKPVGVEVTTWPLNDSRDIHHIRDRILELLIQREGEAIALNASGGTRPMSIAAYEIFQEFKLPVFYVHPYTDEVTWLHDRSLPSVNCADKIKLRAFFTAYGAEPQSMGDSQGVPTNLRDLTDTLVTQAQHLTHALAALNWLAQNADNRDLRSPPMDDRQLRWDELQVLIELFRRAGILEVRRQCLEFADEDARFYANGGWLEAHVYGTLYGLRSSLPQIQDVGRSIEIVRQASGKAVKNELDVAFLANNHCYVIECKTKRFGKHDSDDSPGAETLYKLDTLRYLFGTAQTMLVSYQALSTWDKQRAKDLGIAICEAEQLPRLDAVLRRWIH
jgi:hypothetical protein